MANKPAPRSNARDLRPAPAARPCAMGEDIEEEKADRSARVSGHGHRDDDGTDEEFSPVRDLEPRMHGGQGVAKQ
ncbi:hypothetical protein [Streptomyces sp. NPDC000994]